MGKEGLKAPYPSTVTYVKLKTDLANIICQKHLYDPLNKAMIIGDDKLEKALNGQVCHVYLLQKNVLEQMTLGFSTDLDIPKPGKENLQQTTISKIITDQKNSNG